MVRMESEIQLSQSFLRKNGSNFFDRLIPPVKGEFRAVFFLNIVRVDRVSAGLIFIACLIKRNVLRENLASHVANRMFFRYPKHTVVIPIVKHDSLSAWETGVLLCLIRDINDLRPLIHLSRNRWPRIVPSVGQIVGGRGRNLGKFFAGSCAEDAISVGGWLLLILK